MHSLLRKDVYTIHRSRSPKIETSTPIAKTAAWLSVEDTAKELGVHPDTVRSWIRERKLQATKLGRDHRIRRVDLDKFLKDRTITPKSRTTVFMPFGLLEKLATS